MQKFLSGGSHSDVGSFDWILICFCFCISEKQLQMHICQPLHISIVTAFLSQLTLLGSPFNNFEPYAIRSLEFRMMDRSPDKAKWLCITGSVTVPG